MAVALARWADVRWAGPGVVCDVLLDPGDVDEAAVPAGPLPRGAVPVSPFVRRRIRAARGLPALLVATIPDPSVAPDLVPTLLACASALSITTPEALVAAFAWGAPCVAPAAVAAAVGGQDGRHVLVAGDPLALAEDDRTASRIGWAARVLAEERHDLDRYAAALATRLGIQAAPDPLTAALGGLGMPPGHAVSARLPPKLGQIQAKFARSVPSFDR